MNAPALLLALPLAVSCTAAEVVVDDLAGELADEGEAGKADDHGTFTYYAIERDTRRCVAPLCGGFWVSRIQRAQTICADGRRAERCYVAELDAAVLGGDPDALIGEIETGRLILRGDLVERDHGDFGRLGNLVISEGWVAGAAAGAPDPDAVWVKVEQSGIRCIAAPCEDKAEHKLNSTRTAMIAELDFEPSGATDEELERAYAGMLGEELNGLIVVGDRYTFREGGRRAKGRTVTQFFTRLPSAEVPPAAGACFATGCSGQICADQDVFTTCEWRDEYACYWEATCARQADGACGWTVTEALEACLAGEPAAD